MESTSAYEQDFYLWALQQSQLLRQQKFDQVDWQNVIEEMEDLGRSQYRALTSAVEQLTWHLLKWQWQPEQRSTSWKQSIDKQRLQIEKILDDNPSLKSKLDEIVQKGYKYGRKGAIKELPPDLFPITCPYS
jgi:hypothetical protein